MTKVKFIFCENVYVNDRGNGFQEYQVFNPLEFFRIPFFPTHYSLSMLIILKDLPQKDRTTLSIKLINPDDEVIYDSGENFINQIPKEESLNINVDLKNIPFKKSGQYKTTLHLDGKLVGEDSFSAIS